MQEPMLIGFGRAEITPSVRGMGMMGYGDLQNVAHTAQTPLWARAMMVTHGDQRVAIVVAELCFISRSVHSGVLARLEAEHAALGLARENLLLTAQHTHSGPGGYSESPFYNATVPGFWPDVLEAIVAGIVRAIAEAAASAAPRTLRYGEAAFAPDSDVAFNRRMDAYNRNPDVVPTDDPRAALDRTMRVLWASEANGDRLAGLFSWFAVHGTSMHSDNTALHFDNKGYAAQLVESQHPGAIAGFAQGATGDVSPNFWRHNGESLMRGKYADDDASARYNGHLQGEQALRAMQASATPLTGPLVCAYLELDMARADADADLADGQPRQTAPGELGMAMFLGTEEGPGLPSWLGPAQRATMKLKWTQARRKDNVQAPKITWMETTKGTILGIHKLSKLPRLPLPARVQGVVDEVRNMEHVNQAPWTAHVLAVQLIVIGDVAIAAAPGEFTTVAGRRVRELVARELAAVGVAHVIFAGYANNYAGYCTTPEEYELQHYEGASTHFGKWTLAAYLTAFRQLARKLAARAAQAA